MSYTVGQQVSLQTLIRDTDGDLIDATVSLSITRPDGTTFSPTVLHPALGTYTAVVPTTVAGSYLYVWSATGAAVGIDDGQFEVAAVQSYIASLEDVKRHLNKKDSADDDELQTFIAAAQAMVEREIGPVVQRSYQERYDGGTHSISLINGPVVSITGITEYFNGAPFRVLVPGEYRLEHSNYVVRQELSGQPWVFQGGREDVVITYVAGRPQPIPENIKLGTKELVAHLWRNTQIGRTRRNRGAAMEDDMAPMQLGFSMPARVRELIGGKRPVIF